MIDVLYFAWLRERIGAPKEAIETEAATVADRASMARHAREMLDVYKEVVRVEGGGRGDASGDRIETVSCRRPT